MQGESEGLITGIVMGLLQDCYFSQFIGVNLFLYAILGYSIGCLADNFNKDNIVAPVLLTLLATLLYDLGFYMLNIVLEGYTNLNSYVILNILPELIYNIIFSFIVYYLVYSLNNSSFGRIGQKHRF